MCHLVFLSLLYLWRARLDKGLEIKTTQWQWYRSHKLRVRRSCLPCELAKVERCMVDAPSPRDLNNVPSSFRSAFFSELWNEGVWVQWHPTVKVKISLLQRGSFSNGFLTVLGCSCQRTSIVPRKQKPCFRNRQVLFKKRGGGFNMTHCLGWLVSAPGSSFRPEWSLVWLLSMLHCLIMSQNWIVLMRASE